MTEKVKALLGLARRAGKVASGDAQVEAMLKKGRGYLLLLAEDVPAAQKKYLQWARDCHLEVVIAGHKEELGLCLGLSPRAAVLILDQGFAGAILEARR
ncbi:50S ribosomal protein L30e-like [Acididesulfobacillus acetoxydans]|uniref:50S ribosomal protein L30e-like n=1 Tax=Acididesulfobacillus acetoxydans TaxID=1561005 RepID=A0A8S0W9F1_9FIRM|nr:ribosomal L7Ae/L30e/S12e/Gadd45 family protein [Acididesulfobacillus acetoxydans]CAA7602539.1 50S ribosomal protein L30e-like [Acididesulfobacillus acetoxydans]CEJ07315.1 RNA 2-O ribose methyltransferase, substrate binding [Acididesulfobacillus acetoxydans]